MSGRADRTADLPAEGDLLGARYVLGELIGEGGMSRVYGGRDTELDRPVAVKLLHSADPDDVARMRDEARAAAAIDHPGVVTVYDAGRAGDRVYVVMALIGGETLARRIDRTGPLPPDEVVRIGVAVCDALAAAHAAGVVHRDITPGNIVLGPDGRVTVTDFGIARIGDGAGRTRTGQVIGTPSHMSPEQARGDAHLDGRSDLYSLACCLFTALTGRPPFTDPDPFTVALAHLRETPPRPSELRRGVPPGLERVLLGTLSKDPGRRPPDAAALAAALRRGIGADAPARPVVTRELPRSGDTGPTSGRNALDHTISDVEHDDGRRADRRKGLGVTLIVLATLLVLVAAMAALMG